MSSFSLLYKFVSSSISLLISIDYSNRRGLILLFRGKTDSMLLTIYWDVNLAILSIILLILHKAIIYCNR